MFFGDRSPERNPLRYLEAIHFLLQQYFTTCSGRPVSPRCRADLPLVINTCGWIKGIGASMLNEVYRGISCTHVVFVVARAFSEA